MALWFLVNMVRAAVLKLRKSKSLLITALLFSVGIVVIYYGVLEILHLSSPAAHGPAGGTANFNQATDLMLFIGAAGAILVGARAGSADVSTGVFRDQVSTGRSRLALFGVRILGGLVFYVPFLLVALAISLAVTYSLNQGLANPTTRDLETAIVAVLITNAFDFLLALGLATVTNSRSVTTGVLLVWTLFLQRLVSTITYLGNWRKLLPSEAENALYAHRGGAFGQSVEEAVITAVFVLIGWVVVMLSVGAIQISKMDA